MPFLFRFVGYVFRCHVSVVSPRFVPDCRSLLAGDRPAIPIDRVRNRLSLDPARDPELVERASRLLQMRGAEKWPGSLNCKRRCVQAKFSGGGSGGHGRLRSKSFGEAMCQGRAAMKPWRSRAVRLPTNSLRWRALRCQRHSRILEYAVVPVWGSTRTRSGRHSEAPNTDGSLSTENQVPLRATV
jgi:hypothetical protein